MTVFISQTPTLRRLLPIELKLVYNTVLFSQSRIADLLDQLELVLETTSKNPHAEIGSISLITKRSQLFLPDPSESMHWDQWEGAITDIFSKNAERMPNKLCVVESLDHSNSYDIGNEPSSNLLRSFSYGQLNRAINTVAHYLINSGLQREDVVAIYAFRGVDLVVAIMAVLKAGCTFSVIGIVFESYPFFVFKFFFF